MLIISTKVVLITTIFAKTLEKNRIFSSSLALLATMLSDQHCSQGKGPWKKA